MATYYADFVNGNDANNGLGPDASAVTNKPWKTIAKALGASGISSGDTLYLSPAGPFREVVTVAMTSAVAETSVLGDPANAQGFKTSGGALVSPGEVIWTAYTTNDTTAPSGSANLNLSARDYLTFDSIQFIGGTANIIWASTQTPTNITFRKCVFLNTSTTTAVSVDGAFGVTQTWLIEQCVFFNMLNAVVISLGNDTGSGSDYDIGFIIRNCAFFAQGTSSPIVFSSSGAGAGKPGGLVINNCTFYGGCLVATGGGISTTIPCQVMNNIVYSQAATPFNSSVLGQIIENYNNVSASTTHSNVNVGANTVTGNTNAPLFSIGEERLYGFTPRMFMEPKAGSWMLTFGNDGTYTTAEDFLGLPRPGGGQSATKGIGYLGRGNTFGKETSTVRTGSNAISITGPGTQDFQLPVDATATTCTVYVRYDATYAGTKPMMKVLNGSECGVTDATATAVGAANTWEAISLNFTPTKTGIVTIRLQSSDTNGAGVMFADDFSCT